MIRHSIATPCPVPSSLDLLLNTDHDETTTTVDFTTAFRASFRDVKPRRRQRASVQFAIHEDQNESQQISATSRATLLQPPRRTQGLRNSQEPERQPTQQRPSIVDEDANSHKQYSSISKYAQAPKRSTARLSLLPESTRKDSMTTIMSIPTEIVKPIRRKTLYIPNEDTTMPTMYMGIFSPIKDLDLRSSQSGKYENQFEVTGIAAKMADKRGLRKSFVAAAPRRGILRPSSAVPQEAVVQEDRYGKGDGKENVPPGKADTTKQLDDHSAKAKHAQRSQVHSMRTLNTVRERTNLYAPTTASVLRQESPRSSSIQGSQSKPAWNGGTRPRRDNPILGSSKVSKSVCSLPEKEPTPKPRVPTRFVMPVIQPESALQQYSVLQEDISNPSMYEENWLQHQEIAITQLVNNLFSANESNISNEHVSLRRQIMEAFNSGPMLLMYKRLQAALLYGSLSVPHDTLAQGARLQNDIGLRRQFTDLWLYTYSFDALEPALEVVVGRECRSEKSLSVSETSKTTKSSKSRLRNFIEAFLIRNEDSKPTPDVQSRTSWSYERTLLRSLFLVKILDMTKTESSINLATCLFQKASPYKASKCVVQALISMLNPAAGDCIRALNHIDYHVDHVQCPLEEFNYRIENLAVDLRDGVRLTRIAELLLYPSSSPGLERSSGNETTTIVMPEGDLVEFADGQDWPLSQHLKTNCQSRAVMLWNVQLALSALKNIKGMDSLLDGITADDIVDGFREKTIRLLWALVGKWGLSGLINWQDLGWETRRLQTVSNLPHDDLEYEDDDVEIYTFEKCKALLRGWARAVASCHGIDIQNFTTSFADGRVFEAIVNEYEPFLSTNMIDSNSTRRPLLRERLIHLGCSTQFANLFDEPKQTHIFDRDFVLASLAFLSSRLLAPSRRARAATVIQRAWRLYWSKVETDRKQEKKQVAMACAERVASKQENRPTKTPYVGPTFNASSNPSSPTIDSSKQSHILTSPTSSEDIWLSL